MDTLINIGNEEIMRSPIFIDKHPTQFWNLVYGLCYILINHFVHIFIFLVFQRINLRHNLDQLILQSKLLQTESSDTDSGSHSMDSSNSIGLIYFSLNSFTFILVEIKLSWDSDLVNSSMTHPPMYRVYKEYRKPNIDRNLEILKYRYDFLQTIVESIKNVSVKNVSSIRTLKYRYTNKRFFQNDCNSPLLKMLWEFQRRPEIGVRSSESGDVLPGVRRSCYREALFLLISAVGKRLIK